MVLLDKYCKPLDPDSRFCIFWDIIHLLFISFYLFIFPLEASYKIDFFLSAGIANSIRDFIEIFGFICFALVIIINFNKSYYDKGNFVTKRKKIFKHYLKYHFIIDAIGYVANILRYFRSLKFTDDDS